VASTQPHIMTLLKELDMRYYPQNVTGAKILRVESKGAKKYWSDIPKVSPSALLQMWRFINDVEALAR